MGVLFSCPVEDDGECGGLVAAAEEEQQATFLKASLGSGKLRIEGSLSFKRLQLVEPKIPIAVTAPVPVPVPMPRELLRTRFADAAVTAAAQPESPKHEAAAVTLQKVYKSFRTRRRLADCAVLVEQNWWELLDFALLKRSSVSFFDIERQETAVSKWARARTRAAKVGKGLSKDEKARKLALQHWLEAVSTFVRETAECSVNFRVFAKQCAHVTAEFSDEQIDPRHRYGHNLHYYYDCWLRCESREPFFYWLDIGEGKEINLEDRCPRSKLLSQCIKYLGPKEREEYEVVIEDGKFMYKNSRQILDSSGGPRDAKWIFVLSTSRNLYVGQKKKGTFQHSSFLAGGAASAAGRLVVEDGVLKAIWPHSGHYRPTEENFQEFQDFLRENKVDLSDVKMSPTEEDEEFWSRLRSIPSERCTDADKPEEEMVPAAENIPCQAPQVTETTPENVIQLQETSKDHSQLEMFTRLDSSKGAVNIEKSTTSMPEDHEEDSDDDHAVVPREKIIGRANSYQLGKQGSFKWTTGAGPRIICVRDYPPELQHRALEEVHLSPRRSGRPTSRFSSPQRGGSPMSRGCEPLAPREAFHATHLQQGLLISL
ncbi:IQ domain-containing protein IQM5-like isoform X1 [Triticum dicoccoides]|uniref:IQ domain-containing protein IQM5-like isoform X1 n=1 Tax=Triticum dicoccoides TaxID=85692 RepID=UPI0018900534|nr:IQ domain-containing protein IQM5-like isoform X1 [Triticum dicoccoides]